MLLELVGVVFIGPGLGVQGVVGPDIGVWAFVLWVEDEGGWVDFGEYVFSVVGFSSVHVLVDDVCHVDELGRFGLFHI